VLHLLAAVDPVARRLAAIEEEQTKPWLGRTTL
jgi:hypothetical protein